MDRLAEHEAFLRAIFDAPDDDTPRLLYADFLDENGDPHRAELIRLQCEQARRPHDDPDRDRLDRRVGELITLVTPPNRLMSRIGPHYDRGFLPPGVIVIRRGALADPPAFRWDVVQNHPEWFGAARLTFAHGAALAPDEVETLFNLPVTRRVTEWDLSGNEVDIPAVAAGDEGDAGTYALKDVDWKPVVTVDTVEALARNRNSVRITKLDLTNNNLDNDAARALIHSPYLINLKQLDLFENNRLRGKTWTQLLERFGEQVVG